MNQIPLSCHEKQPKKGFRTSI